jgi:Domain of unknown function (DUF3846)
MKNADLPLVIARGSPLIMRANGTTEPLAYTPPHDGTNSCELQESLATLQAAVGGYIEAVAVPGDDSLILLVNEDGLMLKLPPNSQASAVAIRPIVGDAVLIPRTLLR